MGYTHFDKISAKESIAVGIKGSETEVVNSEGRLTTGQDDYDYILTMTSPAIGTAGTFVVGCPGVAGTVEKIVTVLNGQITTADAGLAFKIGTTAITNGAITIAYSGSAQGDIDIATPTAANTVAPTDYIACTDDGSAGGTSTAQIMVFIKKT